MTRTVAGKAIESAEPIRPSPDLPTVVWTIGHSNRSADEFVELLDAHGIELVADVRRYPGSRKNPQFSPDALEALLAKTGIDYLWIPELGGRRKPLPDSVNTRWQHPAFRGYADYMETPEFSAGFEKLIAASRRKATAVMCAEAVWWRCHRALIADLLRSRGVQVLHIMSATKTQEHPYTSAARVVEGTLSYREE